MNGLENKPIALGAGRISTPAQRPVHFLIPARQFRQDEPELMDVPNQNPEILRQDLRNLRTINRYFGGLGAVRNHVVKMFSKVDRTQPVQILDLATGSADHPLALVNLARSLGRRIRITAIEQNPLTLAVARERSSTHNEITIEEGDILMMDSPPKSFDIVLCSLALHHFSRNDAVQILKTMTAVSRVGLIVNDLYRSWPAAWTAWMYTHLTTRNPMTLNDSYVSVLRAFTPGELRGMALEAAIPHPQIFRHPVFRLVLVGEH